VEVTHHRMGRRGAYASKVAIINGARVQAFSPQGQGSSNRAFQEHLELVNRYGQGL